MTITDNNIWKNHEKSEHNPLLIINLPRAAKMAPDQVMSAINATR